MAIVADNFDNGVGVHFYVYKFSASPLHCQRYSI